jgi:hypothetical protein
MRAIRPGWPASAPQRPEWHCNVKWLEANGRQIQPSCDRAQQLRAKLADDIAALTAQAEAADAENHDPQALPAELARRAALKAKLDVACARLEAEARAEAAAARPDYEAKKAAYDATTGRRQSRPTMNRHRNGSAT